MKKTKKVSKKGTDKMMSKEISCDPCGCKKSSGCGGFAYFLGAIGSAVYYISASNSLLGGVFGILKSLVWPAFVVYDILKYIAA